MADMRQINLVGIMGVISPITFGCAILIYVMALCSCVGARQRGENATLKEQALKAQVADLVKHINDEPNLLHADITPAVENLIKIGRPALRYGTLELLNSDDLDTRMRAWQVVEGVTTAEMGFVVGEGWPKREDTLQQDEKWRQLWRANGSYKWDAPKEARDAAYQKWLQWLNRTDSGEPSQ
jgi:hypothetical protein